MFVSGFTFVRNAIKFDYPVAESIASILPLCDELVVLVGNSEDGTRDLIENIGSEKIKIFDSVWDDSLREGGKTLAVETDKAFSRISEKADWAFYLQADEVVHEKYLPAIKEAMIKYKENEKAEGLLFNYLHFYGSYKYIADSRKWYRKEVRVIRNDKRIKSYRDAQGFRMEGRKLNVKPVDAFICHYGWVKPPEKQQEKQKSFHKMWHNDEWLKKNIGDADQFEYSKIDSLQFFTGTHPAVILQRTSKEAWEPDVNPTLKKISFTNRLLFLIEKFTGWRIGEYKNYRVI